MDEKSDDFLKRLLATFRVEAAEHVKAISLGLIELERRPLAEKQEEIIEAVFRETHSLKGAARAVNVVEVETICQSMESVFFALKRKEIALSRLLLDLLHKATDALGGMPESFQPGLSVAKRTQTPKILRDLESMLAGTRSPALEETTKVIEPSDILASRSDVPSTIERALSMADTVRISTAKLNSILLQAEELRSAKLAASQRVGDLREILVLLAQWKKEREKSRILGPGFRQRGFKRQPSLSHRGLGELLEQDHTFVKSLESKLAALAKCAEHDQRSLQWTVDDLLEEMKKVVMLPFSSALGVFPRFVRDLARDQGKEAEVTIEGGEIEIDRRILEELKDPLLHLVRNCVDHGIGAPEERERKGKLSRGRICLAVAQKEDGRIEILVSDDGAGIDVAKVREAGVKLGMLSRDKAENLARQEALCLIFESGVSTSPIITDISGRGLGLSIVREKVEKLAGTVSVETNVDLGTTFRLLVPMTVAAFRGVVVRVADHVFVFPTNSVERVLRMDKEGVKTVEGRETIELDSQVVPLVWLSDGLQLPRNEDQSNNGQKLQIILLNWGDKRIAFLIDEVVNEQEVLVKTLPNQLSGLPNVSGLTVLGTGTVVPIVNVSDLMKSAGNASAAPGKAGAQSKEPQRRKNSILIVEDSITARTLLKNILESAGYNVRTSVDGADALTALKTEDFDLVVSDVEMPRMDGFDLTARIRADKKLCELPMVLVTALESREDRERGIDVGANAYIVKSTFDQSNLLEVVERLIGS
ncbi:MAG: response regulator [Acidobacteria bacterium]|nr:response regulator [Acidobacteriota bacterium]